MTKWLGKRYLGDRGDRGESLASELIDFGKDKIPDMIERRNAEEQIDRLENAGQAVVRLSHVLTFHLEGPEWGQDAARTEL